MFNKKIFAVLMSVLMASSNISVSANSTRAVNEGTQIVMNEVENPATDVVEQSLQDRIDALKSVEEVKTLESEEEIEAVKADVFALYAEVYDENGDLKEESLVTTKLDELVVYFSEEVNTEDEGNEPAVIDADNDVITTSFMGQIMWDDETNGWNELIRPTTAPSDPNQLITLWKYIDGGIEQATQITLQNTDPSGDNYCTITATEGLSVWSYTIGNVSASSSDKFFVKGPEYGSYAASGKALEKVAGEVGYDENQNKFNYITYTPDFKDLTINKNIVPSTETGTFSFSVNVGDGTNMVPYKGKYTVNSKQSEDGNVAVDKTTSNGKIEGVSSGSNAVLQIPFGVNYEVEENNTSGYIVKYDDKKSGVVGADGNATTVTNISNKVKVSMNKIWNDNNDPTRNESTFLSSLKFEYRFDEGDWQTVITSTADGKPVEKPLEVLGIEDGFSYVIDKPGFSNWTVKAKHGDSENFPAARVNEDGTINIISYRITESSLDGYISSENNGTITNTKSEDFTATINWKDASDKDNRPTEVTLQLTGYYYDGTGTRHDLTEEELISFGTSGTIKISDISKAEDSTSVSIPKLPSYSVQGYPITYYVIETTPEGYSNEYNNGNTAYGTNVTQCYNGGTITNTRRAYTSYSATKKWVDAGDVSERPTATVYLYRYANGTDISTASPVVVMDKQGKSHVLSKELPENTQAGEEYTISFDGILESIDEGHELFKYDGEGREYIYFVKEVLTPKTDGDGTRTSAEYYKEYKDKNGNIQNALYNGGTLINSRIPMVDVSVGKEWKTASLPDIPKGTEVTLKIKQSTNGSDWTYVQNGNTDLTITLSGFSADQEKISKVVTLPKVTEEGANLQYQVEEVSVKKNNNDISIDNDGKMTIDNHTYTYSATTLDMNTVTVPTSLDKNAEAELIGTNVLSDEADYTVKKNWTGFKNNEEQGYIVNIQVKRYLYDGTEDKSFKALTCELDYKAVSADSFKHVFEDLPLYDAQGYRYDYRASEVSVIKKNGNTTVTKDWGTTIDYNYDFNNKKIDATINNYRGEGGKYITVTKKWVDDGDSQHRQEVIAKVYDSDGKEWNGKEVTLSEANGWTARIGFSGDEEIAKYNAGITVKEYSVGGHVVKYGTRSEFVDDSYPGLVYTDETNGHIYKVKNEKISEGNYVITNVRVGTVSVEVDKIWQDGNRNNEERPNVSVTLYKNGVIENENISLTKGNLDTSNNNKWVKTIENLAKYDENGKQIVYTIEEGNTANLKADEYVSTLEVGAYVQGNYHSSDVQQYTLTNKREGITEYKVHKIWKDTELTTSRPDIRVDLYYSVGNGETISKYGEGALADYQTEEIDYVWSSAPSDADYDRMCTVPNLMKYSPIDGSEIHYYSKETMPVRGDYETYYWTDASRQTAAKHLGEACAANGEYIENRLEATININGTKLWMNLQNGTQVSDLDTSKINITLYRYVKDTNGNKPADFEEKKETEYKVAKINLKKVSSDNRKFLFADVDKYDSDGKLYTYEMQETIEGKMGYVYSNDPNGFQITNTFQTGPSNNRIIKVSKSWNKTNYTSEIASSKNTEFTYPRVTFKLYRSNGKSETDNGIDYNSKPVATIIVETTKGAESATGEFPAQLIWSENGIQYKYAVCEITDGIPAYTILDNDKNTVEIVDDKEYTPTDKPGEKTAEFTNKYEPGASITLKGTKVWKDANNVSLRPDTLTLKVYRKANGSAASTAINEELLTQGDDYKVEWTKNDDNTWTYEITGKAIVRYAPNGQAFTYRIEEEELANYTCSGQSVQSGSVTSENVQNMTTITNNLKGTYTVSKVWDDNNNEYALRPTSVVVALQKRTNGTDWEYVTTANNNDSVTPLYRMSETKNDVTETKDVLAVRLSYAANKWTYTFTNLDPKCSYRGVEVAAGVKNGGSEDTHPYYLNTENGEKPMIGSYSVVYAYTEGKTTVTNKLDPTQLLITKTWTGDNDNYYDSRPLNKDKIPTITVKIQRRYVDESKEEDWKDIKDSKGNTFTKVLSSSKNGITWEINNLPKCDYSGKSYEYRAVEVTDNVQGYGASHESKGINNTSITNTLKEKSISVTKKWNEGVVDSHYPVVIELTRWVSGGTDTSDIKVPYPQPMTITLDGTADDMTNAIAGESSPWVATWNHLPKCDNAGHDYIYKVEEISINGETVKNKKAAGYLVDNGVENNELKISNTLAMEYTVSKEFFGDTYAARPSSITVQLQRTTATTINESTSWENVGIETEIKGFTNETGKTGVSTGSHTFTDLPKYDKNNNLYTYRAVETKIGTKAVTNNFASGYDVTYADANTDATHYGCKITNTMRTIVITGTKEWDDQNNFYNMRPSTVTVKLYAGGTLVTKQPTPTWRQNGNTWTFTFSDLPQYDVDGNKIVYTVKEPDTNVPKGYTAVNNSLTGDFANAAVSTSSAKTIVSVSATYDGASHGIINKLETVDVEGTKTWTNTINGSGTAIQPSGITLTLKNGNATVTVPSVKYTAPTAKNSWTYKFADVPKYDSTGKTITYTVEETAVPGYTESRNETNNKLITNTLDTVEITATKVWNDQNNKYNTRPSGWNATDGTGLFVVYADYGDGNGFVKLTTQPECSWTKVASTTIDAYTFKVENLQKCNTINGAAVEIKYAVREDKTPASYTQTVSEDGKTITNTLGVHSIDVTVNWVDNNNSYSTRVDNLSLTLQCKVEGGDWTTVTMAPTVTWTKNTDNTWTFTYTGLPDKDVNGNDYSYRVIETTPTGYHTDANTSEVNEGKVEFTNVFDYGYVQVNKVFADTGDNGTAEKPLATFEIKNEANTRSFVVKTNKDGQFVIGEDGSYVGTDGNKFWLIPGKYTLTEQAAEALDDGCRFTVDTASHEFTVVAGQTVSVTNGTDNVFRNTPIRGSLSLTKMDEKYIIVDNKLVEKTNKGQLLGNAEFKICLDQNGNDVITTLQAVEGNVGIYKLPNNTTSELTNSLGVPYLSDGKLLCGTYYIVETGIPEGYYVKDTQSPKKITIGADTNTTIIDVTSEMENTLIEQPFKIQKDYEIPNITSVDAEESKINESGSYVSADATDHIFEFTIERSEDSKPGFEYEATVTTDENGIADFGYIPYGTYTVTETAVNEYVDNVFTIYVTKNGIEYEEAVLENGIKVVHNTLKRGSITGTVIDSEYNEILLPGAVVGLYVGDVCVGQVTTGEDGSYTFENIPYGNYTIKEVISPENYELTQENLSVSVEVDGKEYVMDPIENDPVKSVVSLHKIDNETDGPISGVEFTLTGTDFRGKKITQEGLKTDEEGNLEFDAVPVGVYTLTEIKVQDYEEPHSYTITVTNQRDESLTSNIAISSVEDNDAKDSDDSVMSTVTETNGTYVITNTRIRRDFSFVEMGTNDELDLLKSSLLAGGHFGIFSTEDASGEPLQIVEADENGHVRFPHLSCGTWFIQQIDAPDNYEVNENIYRVDVEQDGTITTELETCTNEAIRGNIEFTRVDKNDTSHPIKGVQYVLFKRNPMTGEYEELTTTESDENGRVLFENLLIGVDYRVVEKSPADGYHMSSQVTDIVLKNEDGKAVTEVKDSGNGTLVEENGNLHWLESPTKVFIKLEDSYGNLLAGGQLIVKNEDGTPVPGVKVWVTSAGDGYMIEGILCCGKTYILEQLSAPDGYEKAEPIKFTLSEQTVELDEDFVQEFVLVNKKIPVKTMITDTGDQTNLMFWVVMNMSSLMVAAFMFFKRRRWN